MKLKLLLMGSQQSMIDEFFKRRDLDMQCLTTSNRMEDIENHLAVFAPDYLLVCLKSETAESLKIMADVRRACDKNNTTIVIYGKKEDLDFFKANQAGVADVAMTAPLPLNTLYANLEKFYNMIHDKMEEANKAQEQAQSGISANLIDHLISGIPQATANVADSPFATAAPSMPQMAAAAPTAAAPQKPQPSMAGPTETAKKHVLVVDDDPNMLKLIKMHLEPKYEVATAINGGLAMRFLASKSTDLVLLDYEMPIEDGASVLAKIRRLKALQDTPVIFLTGVKDPNKIKKALANKPDGYLLKPIDKEKLLAAIAEKIG